MSDNPGNEAPELISLGVDIDGGSFNALNAAVDALNSRIDSLIETAARLALTGDDSSAAFLEQLQGIGRASLDSERAVIDLSKQIDQLAEEYNKVAQSANQANEAMSSVGSQPNKLEAFRAARLGQYEGMLPSADEMANGIDTGDTGGGSLFGVAHAASVAGHALGAPGLREAGAFLYIEEGLKRVMPLFSQLNETITETPNVLSPVIAGLTELGVPLAGLLVVAAPIAVAVAGVVLAMQAYNHIMDEQKAAIEGALGGLAAYYKAVGSYTTEQAQAEVTKDQNLKENADSELKQVRDQIASGRAQAAALLGDQVNEKGEAGIMGPNGVWQPQAGGQFAVDQWNNSSAGQALINREKELSNSSNKFQQDMEGVQRAIDDGSLATNDYNAAIKKSVEASKAQAEEETKIADLRESGTAKQVQAEMDRIKHQVDANQAQLDILKKLDQTNPDVIAAENKIIDDNAELSISYGELSGDVLELAKARDAEADAIKEQLKQMKAVEKAEADYNQAREKAVTDLAAQDAAAKQHEATAERQYTQGSLEDTEARRQIALKESREEVKLKEDTANHIADIGAKLGEKQTQDILNLSRQLYDDQIKYQESAAKYEREAQDQAVDDKKEHLQRLADLNKKDTADETEALLDRNFKKLYTDGLHRQESVDKENDSYRQREDKLADHLRIQERELAISTQQEEAHQKLALQRKLEDDQRAASAEVVQSVIAANRKLQVMEQLEHQQLTDLTAMENYKIRLLHQGLTDELKLYAQQEQAKLALLAHTRDQILAQNPLGLRPQGMSRTGSDLTPEPYQSGPTSRTYDSGGSFGGGDMWSKGSLAEDVRFASGKGYNLGGSAIVYPLESGSVKPSGGKNIQFSPTLNVNVPPGQQIDGKKLMNELWGEFQSLIGAP